MKSISTVSVVGLGKLGTPFLVTIASRGYDAIGVDVNESNITKINHGISPVFEPRVPELLKQYHDHIQATTDTQIAILNSQLTFIIVPTPSEKNGAFTNKYVREALQKIGTVLKTKSDYHLVAVVSTIMPGSMNRELRPALENAAAKQVGRGLGFCYNPTFIALGNVVGNLLEPDFVLIGESDTQAGTYLANFYNRFCTNRPPIRRMNFINAEISKLALNTFITTKISYANMLAEVCEKLPGADVDVVTQAIGSDSRVGQKYLKGAVAYGGPCFPRDNRALTTVGKKVGVQLTLAKATDTINLRQTEKLLSFLTPYWSKIKTVGIVGLAYKPNTSVTDESQGINLITLLKKHRKEICVYDPVVAKQKLQFANLVSFAPTLKSLITRSDAVIVTLAEPHTLKELQQGLTKLINRPIIIIDCWRALIPEKFSPRVVYIARGRSPLVS